MEVSVQEMIQRAKRKRLLDKSGAKTKLGMMRHFFILLDMSQNMKNQVLFVFLKGGLKQNAGSLLTPFYNIVLYALSHGSLHYGLHGVKITAYFKDSDWLLKNLNQ